MKQLKVNNYTIEFYTNDEWNSIKIPEKIINGEVFDAWTFGQYWQNTCVGDDLIRSNLFNSKTKEEIDNANCWYANKIFNQFTNKINVEITNLVGELSTDELQYYKYCVIFKNK